MTCSGWLALAVAHGAAESLKSNDKLTDDPAVKAALGMLGREIAKPKETRPTDLYFLWSLERVGVLYNLEKISNKDWYAWGRVELLDSQHDDGTWVGGGF